jgi:hypothetical protein
VCRVTNGVRLGYEPIPATIEPEPPETEREAILAAVGRPTEQEGEWAQAALLEGIEDGELDP